jgi:hypothetical protein
MSTVFDLLMGAALVELAASYTENRYANEIYGAAAAYWQDGSRGGFKTRMNGTIKFGLNSAFEQGAGMVDVPPEDFSNDDKALIAQIIDGEKSHVDGLLEYIDKLANTKGAKLSDASPRVEMWVKRYPAVISEAMIYFGKKKRLAWRLGEAEHCETCRALSKIVAWAQEWDEAGIKPKDPQLECHGFNCACEMVPTKKRRSPKALQRIYAALGA